MGKSKKANKPLTQEEIWDDSALVQSWDEAVEEYKLYHSIQARGENVEDLLKEAEAVEDSQEVSQQQGLEELVDEMDHGHDAEPSVVDPTAAQAKATAEPQQDSARDATRTTEQISAPTAPGPAPDHGLGPAGAAPTPHVALAQVQDEGLKNLMMAWYYAGYYTGLYEGQQRASQNKGP
ncbi:uncharacterized protein BO97DRAFT_402911 [Aspergillus homomorphus CBS 101889]|uniref:Survival Motor Neuron Gemin2-binding domain-containing protein n=1 Tax=Aspergillus homomorphus (strain CBS 101889) TaxID=1450537 RepID=A0A395IBQ0_ASPHC|nr:hypothetical protein BO97DRAFT_402911 [Aspergillus homomorphus CBS 101889]RAL16518.1 hypothetical protein BO97DRAFT_402911 [Aspergillus homomorphus CBS 101889]